MNRKKRNKRTVIKLKVKPLPRIYFNPFALRLIIDALKLFHDMLEKEKNTFPNVPFAKEVSVKLRSKLVDLIECEDWKKEVFFDHNETWVIYSSLHLYVTVLHFTDSVDTKTLQVSTELCKLFTRMAAQSREVHP